MICGNLRLGGWTLYVCTFIFDQKAVPGLCSCLPDSARRSWRRSDILSHLLHLLLPYSLAKCLASIRRHGEHALLNSLIFGLGAESLLRVQMGAARSGAKERRSP